MKCINSNFCRIAVFASGVLALLGLFEVNSLAHFAYRLSYEQGIAFWRTHRVVLLAFVGSAFCGVFGLSFRKSAGFINAVAILSVCASLAGLAILTISPGKMGIHSIRSAGNECVNNARRIDSAKEKWAIRTGATNGSAISWDDIASDFANGFPVCPDRGGYTLGNIGEPVRCSIPSHGIAD